MTDYYKLFPELRKVNQGEKKRLVKGKLCDFCVFQSGKKKAGQDQPIKFEKLKYGQARLD